MAGIREDSMISMSDWSEVIVKEMEESKKKKEAEDKK